MDEQKFYKRGENVREAGKYICVPCGFHHEYKIGDKFGECTSCISNNKDEELEDIEGTGLWEKESN